MDKTEPETHTMNQLTPPPGTAAETSSRIRQIIRHAFPLTMLITLGVLVGVVWWKKPEDFATILADLQPGILLWVVPLLAVDYIAGGLRYRVFFNGRFYRRIPLFTCIRANWATMFISSVTPAQTGGVLGKMFILWRAGATISEIMLVAMINLIGTLVAFMVSAFLVWAWLPGGLIPAKWAHLLNTGLLGLSILIGLILLTFIVPAPAIRVVSFLFRALPLPRERKQRLNRRLVEGLETIHTDAVELWHRARWILFAVIGCNFSMYISKFLVGYVVAMSLGYHPPLVPFLALQVIQSLVVYFGITPGATGVAEVSSVVLMGLLLPQHILGVYTLVWRLIYTYVGAAFGAAVVFRELAPKRTRRAVLEEKLTLKQ